MSVHTNLGKVVQLSDTESHVAHDTTWVLQEGGNLRLNTTIVIILGWLQNRSGLSSQL